MVKVVVVVVVMIRAGSFGSAARLDWENLREERLRHASSLLFRSEVAVNGQWDGERVIGSLRRIAIRSRKKETNVVKEFGYDLKNCR
jgi:hypothetical protein